MLNVKCPFFIQCLSWQLLFSTLSSSFSFLLSPKILSGILLRVKLSTNQIQYNSCYNWKTMNDLSHTHAHVLVDNWDYIFINKHYQNVSISFNTSLKTDRIEKAQNRTGSKFEGVEGYSMPMPLLPACLLNFQISGWTLSLPPILNPTVSSLGFR